MPTRNAKISGFGDVWMFDRERVVAADKAEYKDFQRAYGRRMLHDEPRVAAQWSEGRTSSFGPRRRDRATRGCCRRHGLTLELLHAHAHPCARACHSRRGLENPRPGRRRCHDPASVKPARAQPRLPVPASESCVLHCVNQSNPRIYPPVHNSEPHLPRPSRPHEVRQSDLDKACELQRGGSSPTLVRQGVANACPRCQTRHKGPPCSPARFVPGAGMGCSHDKTDG